MTPAKAPRSSSGTFNWYSSRPWPCNYHFDSFESALAMLMQAVLQVITHGNTFTSAVQKMQRALTEFHIRGVKTNIPFLENVLRHPEFLCGEATTSFIERNPQLFQFSSKEGAQASKLLTYLAELVCAAARRSLLLLLLLLSLPLSDRKAIDSIELRACLEHCEKHTSMLIASWKDDQNTNATLSACDAMAEY